MKIVYLLYQYLLVLPIALVLTILTALTTLVGSALGDDRIWGYYPGKLWSILLCRLLFLPVKVVGQEHIDTHKPYIFVANHQGAFDIFLIYGFLGHDFKWLMKESIGKIPLVGAACKAAGFVFINRDNKAGIVHSMEQANQILKSNHSLAIFAEGTRSRTGKLGRFKRGAFQLADTLQLPVVPLSINGSFEILPKGKFYVHRHPLSLIIHKPIQPEGQGPENLAATREKTFAAVAEGLEERYK